MYLPHLGLCICKGAQIKALAGGKSRVAAVPILRFKEEQEAAQPETTKGNRKWKKTALSSQVLIAGFG